MLLIHEASPRIPKGENLGISGLEGIRETSNRSMWVVSTLDTWLEGVRAHFNASILVQPTKILSSYLPSPHWPNQLQES